MSPSTTVRRAGYVTAGALALSLSGVAGAGAASGLTLCGVGEVLNSSGTCVKKPVTSVIPTPAPTHSSGGGVTVPLPSVPKLPLPPGSSSGGSSGGSGGSGSGSSSGSGGLQLPDVPTVDLPGGSSGTGSVSGGGLSGPSVPGTDTPTATTDSSSVPGATPAPPAAPAGGGGMLSPAAAYLPTTGILGFTNFSGTGGASIPTVSNLSLVPSPLLASQPAAQLVAVQAPLLAAGEDAGSGAPASTVLTSYGGYALPGLLIVLATAVVGVVGAGNVRVWQARLATRRH